LQPLGMTDQPISIRSKCEKVIEEFLRFGHAAVEKFNLEW
jgi:hypothetical protein